MTSLRADLVEVLGQLFHMKHERFAVNRLDRFREVLEAVRQRLVQLLETLDCSLKRLYVEPIGTHFLTIGIDIGLQA